MKRIAILLLAAVLVTGGGARAQTLDQMTEDQVVDELMAMRWDVGPGSFSLPRSNSTIEIGDGQEILLGETAARYDYLTGGVESPETEAIVWNAADDSMTYFTFFDVGYVTEEDWDKVDPVDFMQQIKQDEVELNAERERVGVAPFYTDGWRQEPVFDDPVHTAYWATDLSAGGERWINAAALRLSRNGYHQIVWAGGGEGFAAAQSTLGGLLDTHRYNEGHRYEDYADGDPTSGMSIGALAAATMGVDFGTVGIVGSAIAIAIVVLKKAWIVVIPLVAGIGALLARRRKKTPTATGTPPDSTPPPAIS